MKNFIKAIKRWWKVKKLTRAIWRQVKIEELDDKKYVNARVNEWLENNEFRITREQLETNCVSRVERTTAKNITRNTVCQ